MKFRDLFVDYCVLEGLRIVRVLNLDIFLAIRNSGGIADSMVVRYLDILEREKLKNNELTASELYEEEYRWHDLEYYESTFEESRIEGFIERAKQNGYFEKKK